MTKPQMVEMIGGPCDGRQQGFFGELEQYVCVVKPSGQPWQPDSFAIANGWPERAHYKLLQDGKYHYVPPRR